MLEGGCWAVMAMAVMGGHSMLTCNDGGMTACLGRMWIERTSTHIVVAVGLGTGRCINFLTPK